jgi:glycosyltransferase involved in cell wall biosynthesis
MSVVRERPYVVYWNNIPAPYMVERFNALVDKASFDFEVWFNDRVAPDRSWEVDERNWRFKYRYMTTTRLWGRTQHWPLPLVSCRPDILVSLYGEPAFIFGWLLARMRGVKTAFRVLMTHDSWVSRHPAKDAIKRFLFKRVDAIETPGEDGKRYAMRYGASADRIFFASHTVDVAHFQAGSARSYAKRTSLRSELGLCGTTFIYVGRLWWGKGVNYLLEAFETIQQRSAEAVSLLLVGDGADETALRRQCADRHTQNVVFAGFRQKAELPQYYALADVFVFPTLGDPYGLVVDEAMACSLPVISTSAAGEIRDRVEEGVNGYIVPPENSGALAERMLELAQDPALRDRMGQASAKKIKDHTPQRWAEDFEGIVRFLITKSLPGHRV